MTGRRQPFEFTKVFLPPGFTQTFEDNLVLAGNRRQAIRALHEWENGICWLCGDAVDVDAPHPHPGSGVIDHVEAKVFGGKLVRDNVHLAHFQCNSLRRELSPDTYTQDEYRAELQRSTFRYENPDIYWRERAAELTADLKPLTARFKALKTELDALQQVVGRGVRERRASIAVLAHEVQLVQRELGYSRALLSHAEDQAAAHAPK